MEPTLSQIKEYVREHDVDVFKVLGVEDDKDNGNFMYGDNQSEVYYQYYLEHSVEIGEWLTHDFGVEEFGMHF